MIKLKTLIAVLVGSIFNANGHNIVSPNLHLRGSFYADVDVDLPKFFPTDMNKNDVELYLSHHKKKTSPIIEVNKDDWLSQCAATFKEYYNPETGGISRSNFYLINEPSGLCADALVCAFDKCMADTDSLICIANQTDLSSAEYDDVASTCNLPTSWLPGSIMFPKNAADVIAAIKYAKKHNLQISIKSTGHSYFAAHTKAGSLMLNMRDYAKYASGNDKIIECGSVDSSDDDVLGDACTLATAREKDAYIRVGGGQTWSEVYNAVNASNAVGNLSKSYCIAGGGSGSVGAAGGWLSGGGLSIGYEREHGLGVDQILEFEVALPSGHHVRVFPTEWDDTDDFITPQTAKVTSLCNSNIVANEDDWEWQPCTGLDVSPEDLWMALRGGGGGTYGITLSVKYQLFEQNPIQTIMLGLGVIPFVSQTGASVDDKTKEAYKTIMSKFNADKSGALREGARRTFTLFVVDFLFAPEKIGVSKEVSLSCGSNPELYEFDGLHNLLCWGKDSAFPELSSAWNRTINGSELAKEDQELADLLSKCIFFDGASHGFGPFSSYSELQVYGYRLILGKKYDDIYPADVVPEAPLPGFTPSETPKTYCSINLPLALLESDDESERDLLFKVLETSGGNHGTGGNVARLGDGMDSVSPTERRSGQSGMSIQGTIDKYGGRILNDYLAAVYKYTSDDVDGFPGFSEYNHFCSEASTVSKTNWTESCDGSGGEAECFSVQELVWGEDLYARLQGIKAAVDPDNLLDCYQCVKPSSK